MLCGVSFPLLPNRPAQSHSAVLNEGEARSGDVTCPGARAHKWQGQDCPGAGPRVPVFMQPLPQIAWASGPDWPLFWINLRPEKEFSWTCLKHPGLGQTRPAEGRKSADFCLVQGSYQMRFYGKEEAGTGSSAEMEARGGDDLEVRGPARNPVYVRPQHSTWPCQWPASLRRHRFLTRDERDAVTRLF